jgi:hypothetical protein
LLFYKRIKLIPGYDSGGAASAELLRLHESTLIFYVVDANEAFHLHG